MHPHEIHHIKTYIVFFFVSVISIGGLIYLYFPMGMIGNMKSSTLESIQAIPSPKTSVVDSGGTIPEKKTTEDDLSGRRMRLTQMLIRSQKELQALEDQRKISPQGLDPVSEQKILKLKEKIANIEKMITEIK